ncbi:helix-turn-helix domain-containing protein [candidate division KSB1 bacterium]|nr:helix-turn-helix domain-containing protein [candidate division KSB1 bacterium]
MKTYPENMNLATAAKYLGVSPVTIKRMLKDREIPAAKIRGRWLFQKALIDEWITENSWSQITPKSQKNQREAMSSLAAPHMHPSVVRLFAALDRLNFSNLDAADWDEAKKFIKEKEAERTQKLINLAERGE